MTDKKLDNASIAYGFDFFFNFLDMAREGKLVDDKNLEHFRDLDFACSVLICFNLRYLQNHPEIVDSFFDFLEIELMRSDPEIATGIFTGAMYGLFGFPDDTKTKELAITGLARGLKLDKLRVMPAVFSTLLDSFTPMDFEFWKSKVELATILSLDLNLPHYWNGIHGDENAKEYLYETIAQWDISEDQEDDYRKVIQLLLDRKVDLKPGLAMEDVHEIYVEMVKP